MPNYVAAGVFHKQTLSQKCSFSLQLSPEPFIKIMLLADLILVVLGITSLLVPIPYTEKAWN
jgi:hypothetical protein